MMIDDILRFMDIPYYIPVEGPPIDIIDAIPSKLHGADTMKV